jgi:hypothetical protein
MSEGKDLRAGRRHGSLQLRLVQRNDAAAPRSAAAARLYYLRATTQFGWFRRVLLNQIKAATYERAVKEKKSDHFHLALTIFDQPLGELGTELRQLFGRS